MKSKNYPILNFNSLQMYNKNGNIGASVPDNKQLSRLLRIKVLFLLAAIGLSGLRRRTDLLPECTYLARLAERPPQRGIRPHRRPKQLYFRLLRQHPRRFAPGIDQRLGPTRRKCARSALRRNGKHMETLRTADRHRQGRSGGQSPKSRPRCASWVRSRTQTANP